jgi:uncharacterized protein YndB with AHSA1/START domain
MTATRISRRVKAPRPKVYRALLDARAVAPTGAGKTTAHTDTYHGRFIELVPDEKVVEVVEFETADPALQGEMTITMTLADADGATELLAVHDGLPPGLSLVDS